jgi:uncharacterized protein involved in response to NO
VATKADDFTVNRAAARKTALFDLGFRPFFLLAGVYAIVCVSTLVGALYFGAWPEHAGMAPAIWHAHEMLYGFVAAAIAGFLLTAVPNWTGAPPASGAPLALLVLVWLMGRVALSPFVADGALSAWIDLAFFPALAITLARPLVRARNRRNYGFLILLTLLFVGNLLFHDARRQWFAAGSVDGLRLALNTVLLVVVVVAGRIVPTFTRNALVRRGKSQSITPSPTLDVLAIVTVATVLAVDVVAADSSIAAAAAAGAALVHAYRLTRWQGWKSAAEPIVWVLHVGYLWLVVGLALKALWLASAMPIAAYWMHAVTAGGFGTMIHGVMTRVALGHTGRALVVHRSIAAGYVLLTLGAVLRVFVAALVPVGTYVDVVAIGATLWALAFAVFIAVYTPILVRPRVDEPDRVRLTPARDP